MVSELELTEKQSKSLMAAKSYTDVVALLEAVPDLTITSRTILSRLGIALTNLGQLDKAIEIHNTRALQQNPKTYFSGILGSALTKKADQRPR